MKTLIQYCNETINNKLSIIKIENNDISIGDSVDTMYNILFKMINNNNDIIYVKRTINGIRFTYKNNVFYLKWNKYWFLRNETQTNNLKFELENIKNKKYEQFACETYENMDTQEEIIKKDIENTEKKSFWGKMGSFFKKK